MKQIIYDLAEQKIIPYVFKISKQPMLFRELLQANKLYNDGMAVEGNIPGFKIRLSRAYFVFILLWHIIIIPGAYLFHGALADINCHLSILLAIAFTSILFASFPVFKANLVDIVTKKIIKQAWKNHFPHFGYDAHHIEVSNLYSEAIEKEVPPRDMQLFILNQMVSDKKD